MLKDMLMKLLYAYIWTAGNTKSVLRDATVNVTQRFEVCCLSTLILCHVTLETVP